MTDTPTTRHSPTKPTHTIPDIKPSLISALRTRPAMAIAYAFTFAFVLCTVFLVFNPSNHSFHNIFHTSFYSSSSYRSQFSSVFSHFFPHTSTFSNHPENAHLFSGSPNTSFQFSRRKGGVFNNTQSVASHFSGKEVGESTAKNDTTISQFSGISKGNNNSFNKSRFSGKKQGTVSGEKKSLSLNESNTKTPKIDQGNNGEANSKTSSQVKEGFSKDGNGKKELGVSSQVASRGSGNGGLRVKKRKENWLELMNGCNLFDGRWVKDDSYPLYAGGSCPYIDEPFNCFLNGRPDSGYQKYRWQPNGCNIPRLKGRNMLELLRGKRLVFVGDSLNRNMWESLVCILRNSVEDKSRVFEASGRHEFRTEGSYSFVFKDYNCSVEFFQSPFLVQEWEVPETNGSKRETLRLDLIGGSCDRYKTADVLIFNTGHWWTHEKTSKGKGYYQEGSHIYGQLNVAEAFHKAMTTWARWVDANINPLKTLVFFRSYSASHFSGGQWNSGGQCDSETEPIEDDKHLSKYPYKMKVLESVMKGMKTPVFYLNVTRITDYRKDAHPSIYRKQNLTDKERRSPLRYQDCSHWCLPGVPDTWNELVYAQLLIKHNQKQPLQQLSP